MAPDQWAVTRRKIAPTAMAERQSRKRVRLSERPSQADHRRRQRQQTLTQAQWIPSRPPSFQEDDVDLKPLKTDTGRAPKRKLVKRNSTLTQMDFFKDVPKEEELDDSLLMEIDLIAKSPQVEDSDEVSRKTTCQENSAQASAGSGTATRMSRGNGREDYESPAKKRRRSTLLTDRVDKSNKRLATPSKTINGEGFQVFSEPPGSTRHQVVEIQDSIDSEVDDVQQLVGQSRPFHQTSAPPKTPPHMVRRVVMSSQSPEREESLSPMKSSRKGVGGKVVQFEAGERMRSPLREKSVNLRVQPRTCTKPRKTTARSRKTASSPASKIVSLKLPKRTSMQSGIERVQDSQALWSLPITSSSSPELPCAKSNSSTEQECLPPQAEMDKGDSNGTEIPCTSQAEAEGYFAEMGAAEAYITIERSPDQGQGSEQLLEVPVGDGSIATSKEAEPYKTPPLANQTKLDEQEGEEDSEMDFDSPIANDTQFNAEVARRTSPLLSSQDIVSKDLSAIPTPRLISSTRRRGSSQANDQQQQKQQDYHESVSEGLLPPAPPQTGTLTWTKTRLVPLNDTLMAPPPPPTLLPLALPQSSSISSPPLQSSAHRSAYTATATATATQRSTAGEVRPASMPHLSQISTQEATQFGLLSSLQVLAPDESAEARVKKEPITIKEDSSSIGLLSLSQIPAAERESQGMDVGLVEVEEEEEIDLDECVNDQPDKQDDHRVGDEDDYNDDDDPDHHDNEITPRARARLEEQSQPQRVGAEAEPQRALSPSPSPSQSQSPSAINHRHDPSRYSPIPGFNNETQSNFTQGGHVTAAYIHRQRDLGMLPKWYTPKPYRVPGYTRR